MTEQKDNYIPDGDASRRQPAMPSRQADEGDEDVLASIARRHASRPGLRQSVQVPADALPVSEVEPPVRKPIDLREPRSGDVFYVRQAVRKSLPKSARSEFAHRLIIHLAVVAALTGLAVAMYFLTIYFLTW